jgi:hypothetical protein
MAKPAPPMCRSEWLIEGELHGHTSGDTIAYLDWCADYEDEQARRRASPNVILAGGCELWWLTRLRAWLGR